ncbi:uncharacterized protein TNCV_134521 [Trichonephila clavipes]|nr:uncharacterized protein TNCV_134521 [Trichonephila clavipes]
MIEKCYFIKEAEEVKEEELENLAKDFAVNKISAAGVSYIVTSRSFIRRFLWFIGVMGCLTFMGFMTIKVILEYLRYPKVLIKEDVNRHKLPFPAVTVCSLNPISTHYVSETSLRKFLSLRKMMQNIPTERFNVSERDACYARPLCKWSWFQETCHCVDNPCLTEFCLVENSSHCSCSSFFCNSETRKVEGCKIIPDHSIPINNETCQCVGRSTENALEKELADQNIDGVIMAEGLATNFAQLPNLEVIYVYVKSRKARNDYFARKLLPDIPRLDDAEK